MYLLILILVEQISLRVRKEIYLLDILIYCNNQLINGICRQSYIESSTCESNVQQKKEKYPNTPTFILKNVTDLNLSNTVM